ncbi:MAG: pyridoxamine 5'-phosphate oxidase family protein [Gammaproteobacteria bacterium]|nr:pyridoxamine 5'-phosphate oxidase family protein [Gammaproteobacteria bacterium]
MTKRSRLIPLSVTLAIVALLMAGLIQAGKHKKEEVQGVNVGAGEMGIEAVIFPGQPLTAEAVKSDSHRDYQRGMTCAECHDVEFDGMTSATQQFVNNFPALEQEQIWEKIVAFLPGRERFAVATVANDFPIATTVDMVLDPEERVLFVVSEVGTEKLLQLRNNANISAVRYKGWTVADGGKKEWRSVQIRGTAEVIESDDPRFMSYLKKYNLVRVTPERAVRRFDLIKVTPQQIYYFDTELYNVEASVYQRWDRATAGT